jgi:putative PIN family toxin of toxin-antitoxin system
MRAVLDANVIVSSIARYAYAESAPARALIAAVEGRYTLVVSDVILNEIETALSKAYFGDRFDEQYLAEKLVQVRAAGSSTDHTRAVYGVATHWQDDLVLSTALSGEADLLVTGDRELLDLAHPYPFRSVHPNDFIRILEADDPDTA